MANPPTSAKNLTFIALTATFFAATAHANPVESEKITQDGLVSRTQELVDAIAVGNQTPWKTYFAADAVYTDETGKTTDKPGLIAAIVPLPKGYSGTIKVVKPQSRILGQTAILSYDLDESETVYGQVLHARYHGTDTWLFRNGRWQIVAGQLLRYYEDPAIGKIDTARLDDFVGTYEITPGETLTVFREGTHLYIKRGDTPKILLEPESPDLFFRPGAEGRRLFRRNENGQVDAMINRRNNEDLIWKKLTHN
jgi:Domain of unknown function (DUF4440)/Domain of unknown function (DUF3471)